MTGHTTRHMTGHTTGHPSGHPDGRMAALSETTGGDGVPAAETGEETR